MMRSNQSKVDVSYLYPTSRSGVAVLVVKNNKLLMIKQGKDPYKGCWGPVHGKMEFLESEEAAVVREAKEEVGLLVQPQKKLWVSSADYGVEKLHWWLASYEQEKIVVDEVEISDYGFFTLEQINALPLFAQTQLFFEKIVPSLDLFEPIPTRISEDVYKANEPLSAGSLS